MNDRPDLEARLSRFLVEEAPPRAPERLIDAARSGVAGTRQNRRAGGLGWRLSSWILSPAGAVAAAVVIALLGSAFCFSDRNGPSIGSGPSTPPPSAVAVGVDVAVPVPVRPGDVPRAAPAGHAPVVVVPAGHQLHRRRRLGEHPRRPRRARSLVRDRRPVHLPRRPDVPRRDLDLPPARGRIDRHRRRRNPASGRRPTTSPSWLAAHPDLDATTPTPVTLGGATGFRLTLSVPAGTTRDLGPLLDRPRRARCASLFLSADPAATYGFGLVGPEIADVFLLDTPSGDTVMVVIDDVDGVDQPGLEAAAMPIVNSLSFSP